MQEKQFDNRRRLAHQSAEWCAMTFYFRKITIGGKYKEVAAGRGSTAQLGGYYSSNFIHKSALVEQSSYANRGKYGISVMFGLLAVAVCTSPKASISKIAAIALSWCFFVFSFAYGNALNMQVQYSDFRTSKVAEDLAELDCVQSGDTVTVHISGTIGLAPSVKNASAKQPLLRTIYIPLNDDGWWGSYGLIHFYGLDNLKHGTLTDTSVLETAECAADNAYHTILTENQNVYIVLK